MRGASHRGADPVVALLRRRARRAPVAFTHTDTGMNRLKDFFGDPRDPESQDDYFEIESLYDTFVVSRATATEIERRLDQLPPPRWIVFHDLTGARHRIQSSHVNRISECTAAQRAVDREFRRARRLEDKKDRRPWEDDE